MASSHGLFESFGAENILELNQFGNSTFTRGAFGHISLALLCTNGKSELVAIKTIQGAVSRENKLQSDVYHEINALQALQRKNNNEQHPNIVKLLALYAKDTTSISIAFEYCPIDLSLALQWRRCRSKHPRLLSMDVIRTIAKDIWKGLAFCHDKGFVHCDIKPGNLLVSSDGYIRLCDFGLARPFSDSTEGKGMCTLFYRAPESLMGDTQNRSPALDIFAAGLVVAELCQGRTLWEGTNEIDQLGLIFRSLGSPSEHQWPHALQLVEKYHYGRLPFAETTPQSWSAFVPRVTESPDMEEFMESTVALDPNKRISAKDALNHLWLSNGAVAERACLLCELVPDELDTPFFLSSNNNDAVSSVKNEIPIRQILGVANCRRGFLSRFETWGKHT